MVRAQDWRPRVVLGSNPAGGTSLRNFGNSVNPTLPMYFGRETLKAVGPFWLVSMPEEVKYTTHADDGVNV